MEFYVDTVPKEIIWTHMISKLKNDGIYTLMKALSVSKNEWSKKNATDVIIKKVVGYIQKNSILLIPLKDFIMKTMSVISGSFLLQEILEINEPFSNSDVDIFVSVEDLDKVDLLISIIRKVKDVIVDIVYDMREYMNIAGSGLKPPIEIVRIKYLREKYDIIILDVKRSSIIYYLKKVVDFTILLNFYIPLTGEFEISDIDSIFARGLVLNPLRSGDISVDRYKKYLSRGFIYNDEDFDSYKLLINSFFHPIPVIYDTPKGRLRFVFPENDSTILKTACYKIGCPDNCPLYPGFTPWPSARVGITDDSIFEETMMDHFHFVFGDYIKKEGLTLEWMFDHGPAYRSSPGIGNVIVVMVPQRVNIF